MQLVDIDETGAAREKEEEPNAKMKIHFQIMLLSMSAARKTFVDCFPFMGASCCTNERAPTSTKICKFYVDEKTTAVGQMRVRSKYLSCANESYSASGVEFEQFLDVLGDSKGDTVVLVEPVYGPKFIKVCTRRRPQNEISS